MDQKISIIMPVYNAERFLSHSIESLLGQTFKDFELIIINDASTDQSKEIALEYAVSDKRIRVVDNSNGKGLPGALTTGLQNATGAYITRADGDDIYPAHRLAIQQAFLKSHPKIAIVGGAYTPFSESGQRKTIFHPSGSLYLAWSFVSNTYFCHPTVMFKKEVLSAASEYPKQAAEDFAFFSKILRKFRGENIKISLIDYREHPDNYSNNNRIYVEESVKKIFAENYLYYNGSSTGQEVFYTFQHSKKIRPANLLSVLKSNRNILRKIRSDYHVSLFSFESILTSKRILWTTLLALLRYSFSSRG